MRRKIWLARAVADLTGRIENIVVLISRQRADKSPASTARRMSVKTFSIAVSIEWWFGYANWNLGSRPFESRWARSWRATSLSSSFERTDRRLDSRIAHPKNPDRPFSGEVRCTQSWKRQGRSRLSIDNGRLRLLATTSRRPLAMWVDSVTQFRNS